MADTDTTIRRENYRQSTIQPTQSKDFKRTEILFQNLNIEPGSHLFGNFDKTGYEEFKISKSSSISN